MLKLVKNSKGITLVALVVTIIVIIIIAGVSITLLTGENGILTKTNQGIEKHKIAEYREKIELKLQEIKTNSIINKTVITLETIRDSFESEPYVKDVELSEEESIIRIITEDDYLFEISIGENGELKCEPKGKDDQAPKATVSVELNPTTHTDEEVIITIIASEEEDGIQEIIMPDLTVKTYNGEKTVTETYTVDENGKYTFKVKGENGRITSKVVNITNIISAADIEIVPNIKTPTNTDIIVRLTYAEEVYVNNEKLTNTNKYQYKVGSEETWKTATQIQDVTVSENVVIYARYYNGTVGIKTATINILNIDKIAPQNATFNLTTFSDKIEGTITLSDNESDINMSSSKYLLTDQSTLYSINDDVWDNAATEITTNPQTINKIELSEKDYYVQVLSADKAGNKKVNRSGKITVVIVYETKVVNKSVSSENSQEVSDTTSYYSDQDGFTGVLTGQGVTNSQVQTGGSYTPSQSKTGTGSRTSTSNNLPSSIAYSDAQGYSGTIQGQGVTSASVQTGGSYTPSQSKTGTGSRTSTSNNLPSSIAYSDAQGYSGTIQGQGVTSASVQTGGTYTPADSKSVTSSKNVYANVTWKWTSSTTSWGLVDYNFTNFVNGQSISYSKDGYTGTLAHVSGNYANPNTYKPQYSGTTNGQQVTIYSAPFGTANYSGTVTKPASDTRTYQTQYSQNYSGTVIKPAVDTRTYQTQYYQNYSGTVTKPAIDTRTYKTMYTQNYTGTVRKIVR